MSMKKILWILAALWIVQQTGLLNAAKQSPRVPIPQSNM